MRKTDREELLCALEEGPDIPRVARPEIISGPPSGGRPRFAWGNLLSLGTNESWRFAVPVGTIFYPAFYQAFYEAPGLLPQPLRLLRKLAVLF